MKLYFKTMKNMQVEFIFVMKKDFVTILQQAKKQQTTNF